MVNTAKLRGLIAERGYNMTQMAKMLGISGPTMHKRMTDGNFWTDEIDKLVELLGIKKPADIFLAKK